MRVLIALLFAATSVNAWADVKAGEKKAQLCLLCHKAANIPLGVPALEAQPAKYLVAAMTAYKTGKRNDPAMKANTANLSARDIADIADYFASRSPLAVAHAVDASKATVGAERVKQLNCAECHQASLSGAHLVPRLAGQSVAYLITQLEAFAHNRRTHPSTVMPTVQGDIENVASYLATLK